MSRRIIIIIPLLVAVVLISLFLVEWWIEAKFAQVLNSNPERAYDINYQDLDLHLFLQGLSLEQATITPLNTSDSVTQVNGSVDYIEIDGLHWGSFLFGKKVDVGELTFVNPNFEIKVVEPQEKKEQKEKPMQSLFGDILSRGVIHSFSLINGIANTIRARDSVNIANVNNLNITAIDIKTDSIIARNLIPFQVGSLNVSVDSTYLHMNDYTRLTTGLIAYNSIASNLELNQIQLSFTRDVMEVSQQIGTQIDLIQAEVGQVKITDIDAESELYGDLEIKAGSVLIDALSLKDFRDKNQPRPPDVEKPMFRGMVGLIPFPMKIDSILIRNSEIFYTELAEGKSEPGTVQFGDINGRIVNITTMPEFQQQYEKYEADLTASLNQQADLEFILDVPYDQEVYSLSTTFQPFQLGILNQTVTPLAEIEVTSGAANILTFDMTASRTQADNRLRLDYQELTLAVVDNEAHDHQKKGFISTLANSAIKNSNLPEDNHYHIAEYQSYRNIYRGPFNFIWESIKEGMLYIVPTGASSILLGDPEKKAKKKRDHNRKK